MADPASIPENEQDGGLQYHRHILRILPHRFPFLDGGDRIIELESGASGSSA